MEDTAMGSVTQRIGRLFAAIIIAIVTTVILTGCWSDYGTVTGPQASDTKEEVSGFKIGSSSKDGIKDGINDATKGSSLADTTGTSAGAGTGNNTGANTGNTANTASKDAGSARENNRDAILADAFYKEVESRSPRLPDTTQTQAQEVPKVQPAVEKGWNWYNNEKYNYTFRFPDWLNFEGDNDGTQAVFTANALGKKKLTEDESYENDFMNVKVTFMGFPKSAPFDEWAEGIIGKPSEKVPYKSVELHLDDTGDSEAMFAREAYVPIDKYGLVKFSLFYASNPDIDNTNFEKKARSAFYEMIYSTQQLYVD